jgi:arginase
MAEAAGLVLPWPEAAVVAEDSLDAQIDALGRELPERPLVLGGCCCAHVGAVRELARRHGRVALVWIDAHGDLNTPETSPSGNAWGMPLRMLIDAGDVAAGDVTLLGARNLDPPERDFITQAGILQELGDLPGTVYVAVDGDVVRPGELDVFTPELGGLRLAALEELLARLPTPAGAGFAGLTRSFRNEAAVARLGSALGL